ncbi:MAG: COX15/CtaA family protein [Planctomycetota bacterium]
MATQRSQSDRLVHWLAVITVVVSLAPIGLGSLVTTLGAGMAFPDWPTSDGQGMLAYPWLSSTGDRFVEHGHRLAGMLVGLSSIALCAAAVSTRRSRSIQTGCGIVLVGVIVQGLLGGLRVRLDQQAVAFGHSVFGCLVFVSLWLVAAMTSPRWHKTINDDSNQSGRTLLTVATLYPSVCLVQYVLGGFIRHLGLMVHEHVAGAILVVLGAVCVVWLSAASGNQRVRRSAAAVAVATVLQIAVGLAVWVSKFGLPEVGWVAVQYSMLQVVARTAHTVVGMSVVATAVYWSVSVVRCSGIAMSNGSVNQGVTTT